jgi:hypothetical protein
MKLFMDGPNPGQASETELQPDFSTQETGNFTRAIFLLF